MSFAEPAHPQLINYALPLFWQAVQRGWLYRLWAHLTRRPERLLNLEEKLCSSRIQNSCFTGTHPVEINRIQGTQGKSDDFDAQFHPLRQASRSRWLRVAVERLRGHDLPPVELVEVDGVYYVRDGHHRISVARSLGQAYIDAEIIRINLAGHVM